MTARMEKVREALDITMMGNFGRAAALAEVEEWETDRSKIALNNSVLFDQWKAAEAEADRLKAALQQIQVLQPNAVAVYRKHGIVFTDIGNDPTNWQHIAFSVYTDLCEVESIARAALAPADRNTT